MQIIDLSAITCPPIVHPTISPELYQAQAGDLVNFTCASDLRYTNGRQHFTMTCGYNGQWSNANPTCEGTIIPPRAGLI